MENLDVNRISNAISLLSDMDKSRLYAWMRKEFFKQDEIVAYTASGIPLTHAQYIEKINKAILQADKGELITDEELQQEIRAW
jgi:hypothetical protein